MRNRIVTIALGGIALCTIATPALARHETKLGRGDYQVHIFPEEKIRALFPDLADKPKVIPPVTTRDFDVMATTDTVCRDDNKQQAPGWVKDVGIYTLRTAPPAFVFGAAGAALGGFTPAGSIVSYKGYGIDAGVQTIGGALGAGINAHEMGKHTAIASCQVSMVQRAQNGGYLNRNILVSYNPYAARGHPITRERFPEPASNDTKPKPETQNTGQVPPPPPSTQ